MKSHLSYVQERQSRIADLFWNKSYNLVKCVYKRSGTPQEFADLLLDILEVLFAKQTGKIMHDLRLLTTLPTHDLTAVYTRDAYELYLQTVNYSAMVCLAKYEFRSELETFGQHSDTPHETRFFETNPEAEAWLGSLSEVVQ